jgi:hypothetical protein
MLQRPQPEAHLDNETLIEAATKIVDIPDPVQASEALEDQP